MKFKEIGPTKIIAHMDHLLNLFPDNDIHNL